MFTHYIDIVPRSEDKLSRMDECARMVKRLHGVFKISDNYTFATAFPSTRSYYLFQKVRVFSSQNGISFLKNNILIDDCGELQDIKEVPKTHSWIMYSKYRIPSRKSMKKNHCKSMRAERLEFADNNCFHFNISSETNKTTFKLFVYKTHADDEGQQECRPDSYGLSVATRPFAVPALSF